ncbi:MAG: DeoR/GlpR family DNA-binding transcription regulator [Ginsengibacter sp.]|jgi:DeoR/GlpR family transcriptional regulator of sugar metabolism
MIKLERQAFIIHQVNLHNKILLTDLSDQMKVSHDTIRRDLQQLSEEGKIIKVHGGALSPSFHYGNQSSKEVYAYNQKIIIAKKAASLIQDGMFILSGGGTTMIELARSLSPELHATFISGSIPALLEYSAHPNIEVIAIGDRISKLSKITVGSEAISKIRQLRVDLCFLGVNAINLNTGISDNDWDIVQVKKAMIESSRKVVCLTISEKINTQQPIQICELKKIDILITELSPENELLQPYLRAGVTVI